MFAAPVDASPVNAVAVGKGWGGVTRIRTDEHRAASLIHTDGGLSGTVELSIVSPEFVVGIPRNSRNCPPEFPELSELSIVSPELRIKYCVPGIVSPELSIGEGWGGNTEKDG